MSFDDDPSRATHRREAAYRSASVVPLGEAEEVRDREARQVQQRLEQLLTGKFQPRGDWARDGVCADGQVDPESFAPIDDETRRTVPPKILAARQRTAAAACRECPVAAQCRDDARTNGHSGVWGGVLFADHGAEIDLIELLETGGLLRTAARQSRPTAAA